MGVLGSYTQFGSRLESVLEMYYGFIPFEDVLLNDNVVSYQLAPPQYIALIPS
jgi:hypothetical protein